MIGRKSQAYVLHTRATMISNFCEAIALCSKSWQIEDVLNRHWQIKGGKFYEQTR